MSDTQNETQENSPDNPESPITMRQLLEAGVHFGHQTKRWNPKMNRRFREMKSPLSSWLSDRNQII